MAGKGAARQGRAESRKAEGRKDDRPAGGSRFFSRALKSSLVLTAAAGLIMLVAFYYAGYSASWRTILRFAMQVLPLFPFVFLGFALVRSLTRLLRLPLPFALALVVIGMAGTLVVAPASVLAVYNLFFAASGDDLDWDGTLTDLIFTAGASLGLYIITGARLWLPYGLILPPLAGFLYLKAVRLP